jgi:uridylate kinase
MGSTTVVSVGGSIVVPDEIDTEFVRKFVSTLRKFTKTARDRKFVLVVGGGMTARRYQKAARDVSNSAKADSLDQIGIASTHLNAEVLRTACGDLCEDPVFINPTKITGITGSVLIGGGWKPGFSTDAVAVYAAERVAADKLINLSNIAQVYTEDPRENPDAKALTEISWNEMLAIVGDEWTPGKNTPFDPSASKKAAEMGLEVVVADGRDLENLSNILSGNPFAGTTIRG